VKILVTGAAGFIGSNLVDRLLADGHEITVSTISPPGKPSFWQRRCARRTSAWNMATC